MTTHRRHVRPGGVAAAVARCCCVHLDITPRPFPQSAMHPSAPGAGRRRRAGDDDVPSARRPLWAASSHTAWPTHPPLSGCAPRPPALLDDETRPRRRNLLNSIRSPVRTALARTRPRTRARARLRCMGVRGDGATEERHARAPPCPQTRTHASVRQCSAGPGGVPASTEGRSRAPTRPRRRQRPTQRTTQQHTTRRGAPRPRTPS